MTRDDILNMPAGYGMRKLLGEKVMGWNQQGKWWVGANSVICPVSVWKPDENISAAFSALYKWLDNNNTYAVHIETVNITTGRLHDVILWGMDEDPIHDARAEDLPLAICRVLLLAVRESDKIKSKGEIT